MRNEVGIKWNSARARYWLRTCALVGENPKLIGKPTITNGGGKIHIGHRFRLASRPIASHLVTGPRAVLEIGDDVAIGCGAAIAAFERIHIGSSTQIGPYVIIMDTNFHGSQGDQSVQHDCRPVIIGAGCRIGSRVTITRGATIGAGAEILAGSVVSSAIPPGVCAAGARARIIGQSGALTSRLSSAAAALPELLSSVLGLDSPPDIDNRPQKWTDAQINRLFRAIDERFGVNLDRADASDNASFADVALAIQLALNRTAAAC